MAQALARLLVDDEALRACRGWESDQPTLWTLASTHSVDALLAWRVTREGGAAWTDESRRTAREVLSRANALEELQRRELMLVVSALDRYGLSALLLKGAAWAYAVYPHPALRPRSDTDLFIAESDREETDRVLRSLGYVRAVETTMALASAQQHYSKSDERGVVHYVDLHWRATNPLRFAAALPFPRALARSVPVDALGAARALCASDALLLACVHRLAHHGDQSGLMWLLDIHQLAVGFTEGDWEDFRAWTEQQKLAGMCAAALARVMAWFRTPVPAGVRAWVEESPQIVDAAFLGRGVNPMDLLASDWRAAGSWRERMQLVRDHLFPPASYVLARYETSRTALLPFLYAHRAIGGLWRWTRR